MDEINSNSGGGGGSFVTEAHHQGASGTFCGPECFSCKICPCTQNVLAYTLLKATTGIKIPFPQSLWKAITPAVPLQIGGGLLQVPSGKHLLSLAPCITYLMSKFIDMVLLWICSNRSHKRPKLPVITREIEHALVWSFCPPHCQRPQRLRDGTHLSCTKNRTSETWSRSYFFKWLIKGGYGSH